MKPAPPSPRAVVTAGLLLLICVMGIGRFAYTPLLPQMQQALGWQVAQAGDVASANFLGYLLGALASARLARRASRAYWLLAALLGSALSTLAGALSFSFEGWLLLRAAAGAASAIGMVLGMALVIDYVGRVGRPELSTAAFPGVGIGIVLSVLVIEGARFAGWSFGAQWAALGLCASACVALALPVLWRLPNRVPPPAVPGVTASRVQDAPTLRRLIAAYGLLGFGYVVTATFIVLMARERGSVALLEPVCWLVVGATAAPSVPIGRALANRFGEITVMRWAFALEALGVLLAGMGRDPLSLVLGGACLGATFLSITALILNAARRAAGAGGDAALGWMTAAFGSGQWLGPFCAGRLAQWRGDFAFASMLAAALLLLGAALLPRAKPVG